MLDRSLELDPESKTARGWRDQALSEVVDPTAYDPEADAEPESLLSHPAVRWSMATEWARIGPSVIFRLILVIPREAGDRVTALLVSLT